MQVNNSEITFLGKPKNYAVVDNYVSRSAQLKKEDLPWLKERGVTDVFNFRTMRVPGINFDEKTEVEKLGMQYHSIPSITGRPKEENVDLFLKEIEEVKQKGGKLHIHCKAGADRTGMYTLIYKQLNGIGNLYKNIAEMFYHGHFYMKYPTLIEWAINYSNKLLLKK